MVHPKGPCPTEIIGNYVRWNDENSSGGGVSGGGVKKLLTCRSWIVVLMV